MSSPYHPSSSENDEPWEEESQESLCDIQCDKSKHCHSPTPRLTAIQARKRLKIDFQEGGILDSQISSQQFVERLQNKLEGDRTVDLQKIDDISDIHELRKHCLRLGQDHADLQSIVGDLVEALEKVELEAQMWREASASSYNFLKMAEEKLVQAADFRNRAR